MRTTTIEPMDPSISVSDDSGHKARVEDRRRSLRPILARILSADAPFVWEIGSGHGHFLTAFAAARPETPCIGVDISLSRVTRAEIKRDRSRLPNLHFIRADALDFLAALPPGIFLSSVFILFPDPWPKRRHHKNRLLQPGFLAQIAERAGEGARIHFRTDHDAYFSQARDTVLASPQWRLVDEPWPFEMKTVFQARAAAYQSFTALRRTNAQAASAVRRQEPVVKRE